VTPEATRDVIEREAPGIGEAMRAASRPHSSAATTSTEPSVRPSRRRWMGTRLLGLPPRSLAPAVAVKSSSAMVGRIYPRTGGFERRWVLDL
jgi:hypothetical protein